MRESTSGRGRKVGLHFNILAEDMIHEPVLEDHRQLDLDRSIVAAFDIDEFLDHQIQVPGEFLVLAFVGLGFGKADPALELFFAFEMRARVVL